jgi:hypothetical protein
MTWDLIWHFAKHFCNEILISIVSSFGNGLSTWKILWTLFIKLWFLKIHILEMELELGEFIWALYWCEEVEHGFELLHSIIFSLHWVIIIIIFDFLKQMDEIHCKEKNQNNKGCGALATHTTKKSHKSIKLISWGNW